MSSLGMIYWLKVVRIPSLVVIVLTQFMVRIFLIGPYQDWPIFIQDYRLYALAFSSILIAAAGYVINDYYDIKVDSINKPEKVIVGWKLQRRKAILAHTALNFMGILLGLFLAKKVGLINFFSAFWLWLYSNQLKRVPFWGNFSVAVLTTLSVFIVPIYLETFTPMVYTFGCFSFFVSLMREIVKDMEGFRGDMHFGSRTLPIVHGIRKTKVILYILLLSFVVSVIILMLWHNNQVLYVYFLVMMLPLIFFVYRLYWADTKKGYRFLNHFLKFVLVSGVLVMPLLPLGF